MIVVAESLHPFASVKTTLAVPGHKATAVDVVSPLSQA